MLVQITCQLRDDQVKKLKEMKKSGVTRNLILREAVDNWLEKMSNKHV